MAEKVEQQKAWLPGLLDQAVEGLQGLAREGAKQLEQASLEGIPREQLLTLSNAGIGPKKLREAKAKLAGVLKEFSDGVQDKKKLERMRADIDIKYHQIENLLLGLSQTIWSQGFKVQDKIAVAEAHMALAEIRGWLFYFPQGQGTELKLENALLESRLYRAEGKYEQAWHALQKSRDVFEKDKAELPKEQVHSYESRLRYEQACLMLFRYLVPREGETGQESWLVAAEQEWRKLTSWQGNTLTEVEHRYFNHLWEKATKLRDEGWKSGIREAEDLRMGPVDSKLVYSQAPVARWEIAVEDVKLQTVVLRARLEKRSFARKAERMLRDYLEHGYFNPQQYIDFKIKTALAEYKEEHPESAEQAIKIEEWIYEVLSDIRRRTEGKPFLEAIELVRRELFPLLRKYHPDFDSIFSPKLFGWANCVTRSGNSLIGVYAARPKPDSGYVYGFQAYDGHDAGVVAQPPSRLDNKDEGWHYDLFAGGQWTQERQAPIYHPVYECYEYAQKYGEKTLNIDLEKLLIADQNVASQSSNQVIFDIDPEGMKGASGRSGRYGDGDAPLGPSDSFWTPMGGEVRPDAPYRDPNQVATSLSPTSDPTGSDLQHDEDPEDGSGVRHFIKESALVPSGPLEARWNRDGSLQTLDFDNEWLRNVVLHSDSERQAVEAKEKLDPMIADGLAYVVNRDRLVWEKCLAAIENPFKQDISAEQLRTAARMMIGLSDLKVFGKSRSRASIPSEMYSSWVKDHVEGRRLTKASRGLVNLLKNQPEEFLRRLEVQSWPKQRLILQLLDRLSMIDHRYSIGEIKIETPEKKKLPPEYYLYQLALRARPVSRVSHYQVELKRDPSSDAAVQASQPSGEGSSSENSGGKSFFAMDARLRAHILGSVFFKQFGNQGYQNEVDAVFHQEWTPEFQAIWDDFFLANPKLVTNDHFEEIMKIATETQGKDWYASWQQQMVTVTFVNIDHDTGSTEWRLPSKENPEGSPEQQFTIPKPIYEMLQKMQPVHEALEEAREIRMRE